MPLCATGKDLNLAEDVLKLGHLLETGLLKRKDAIEELISSASKEEAIEVKLNGIATDWGELMLYFQEHKSRGPVILKASRPPMLLPTLGPFECGVGYKDQV